MLKGKISTKNKATKKLEWVPMEIYRVPLNPEQAVLSCCVQSGRGQQWVDDNHNPYDLPPSGAHGQCTFVCGNSEFAISS